MTAQKSMLQSPAAINALARKLGSYECITKFDSPGEPEGGALAHALSDLEHSCRKFVDDLLPKLVKASLAEHEIYDVLVDIGEELRHIQYHIRDSRFYTYLRDSS